MNRWNVEQDRLGENRRGYKRPDVPICFSGNRCFQLPGYWRTVVRGDLGMASGGVWVADLPRGSLVRDAVHLWRALA